MKIQDPFSKNTAEAIVYSFGLILVIWIIYFAEQLKLIETVNWGVLPKSKDGILGIFLMPLVHSQENMSHLLSNSAPGFLLTFALIYFYREVALKVFIGIWILSGLLLWLIAEEDGSRHIGFSGVIYGLTAFIFFSGVLRAYFNLQVLSLLVVFLYGSIIWGLFPTEERVSWQGHLSGFFVGIGFAIIFRNIGPKPTKFSYEIMQEQGIPLIDHEALMNEELLRLEEEKLELEKMRQLILVQDGQVETTIRQSNNIQIVYHVTPKATNLPPDENI